jgi:hypothetical protein
VVRVLDQMKDLQKRARDAARTTLQDKRRVTEHQARARFTASTMLVNEAFRLASGTHNLLRE